MIKNEYGGTLRLNQVSKKSNWLVPVLVYISILSIFVVRTLLAYIFFMPSLFEIFNILVLILSGVVLTYYYRTLTQIDFIVVTIVAIILGLTVTFTSFYPLLPLSGSILLSIGHAGSFAIIFAAGLALAHQGGPVQLAIVENDSHGAWKGVLIGLLIGFPFALVNAFAFSMMQGQSFVFQDPFLSGIDALQPGIVEEVVYRLTFLNIIWSVLRKYVPDRAVSLAALLALLVHNYAHLSDLFMVQPIFAVVYGAVILLLFGLPMTVLAVKRNLESAISFHWIVDFVRFLVGL